jgi:hypothetical protein
MRIFIASVLTTFGSNREVPVLVAERSKAKVCGRSAAEIVGSKPIGGMGVCLMSGRGL